MRSHHARVPLLIITTIATASRRRDPRRPGATRCHPCRLRQVRNAGPAAARRALARRALAGLRHQPLEPRERAARRPVAAGSTSAARPRRSRSASQPTFSADSRWVAYAIGYSEAQEEKLRQQKKPIHRKLGTLEAGLGRDGDGRWHRDLRLQRQRQPSGHEALRAGAQGPARRAGAGRRGAGRRDAHRPASGNRPRHDVRQRDRVHVAGEGRAARARDRRATTRPETASSSTTPKPDRCASSTPRRRSTAG